MSFNKRQKISKKRKEDSYSVTKTLQKSDNRQVGKVGKILTVDFTGRPTLEKLKRQEGCIQKHNQ